MSAPESVIGIGASAGGLEALKAFFAGAERDCSRIAFLVVQHLDPTHESMMVELLGKITDLRVVQAEHNAEIEGGTVYFIPPGKLLRAKDGRIQISTPTEARGARISVDVLFRSLADAYGDSSVGVVLSGTGSDGTEGLRAIASAGGFCGAQEPESAEHAGMPESAIGSGEVHLALPADKLLDAVVDAINSPGSRDFRHLDENNLDRLLAVVKAHRGTDFRHYKPNTILRRVARRMSMLSIASIEEYAARVRDDETELENLCRDLLIGVTSFFRDPAVFRHFRDEVAPSLVETAESREELRVWVAGCASGEEAYTVAMLLLEAIRAAGSAIELQVFASDIDERALAFARAGVYPESIRAEIPEALLEKYFSQREDGRYEASKKLRDCVIFAHQNLLGDPPFSRIDLVTCRNVLIYLKSEVQDGIISVFHFALRPDGYLMLGGSEGVGRHTEKFRTLSRYHRLYQRIGTKRGDLPNFSMLSRTYPPALQNERAAAPERPRHPLQQSVHEWLNERFAPAAVVVDAQNQIVYFSKKAHRFLRIPEGEPSRDVWTMLDPSAGTRLRGMLSHVRQTGEGEPPRPITIRKAGEGEPTPMEALVGIMPFRASGREDGLCIITFQELTQQAPELAQTIDENEFITQLERELQMSREDLQNTIEEMETTNEELKASNEEAMSVNEELQSANEELETSKEELQSLNEELATVNAQLREKLDEVEAMTNDMSNLLKSTDMGVLFLDEDLRIKRYTPRLAELFRIAEGDLGRPVGDIVRKFDDPDLEARATRVLHELGRDAATVLATDGRIFRQTVLPYRTQDNRIEGVVVTYADITELTQTIQRLQRAQAQQTSLTEIGTAAMDAEQLQAIFAEACRQVRGALRADMAKVLSLGADGATLTLEAGVGWDSGIVGSATVPAGRDSQAGYTLQSVEAVVVSDLETESRFRGPALLTSHGVRSGISVRIEVEGEPWGVLGVHAREPRRFSDGDVDYVTSVAHILGQAVSRRRILDSLRRNAQRLHFSLESSEIGAWEYRVSDGTVFWSDQERKLLGLMEVPDHELIERFWEVVHKEDRDKLRDKVNRCISDHTDYDADFRVVLPSGEIRWIHGAGAILHDRNGEPFMYGVNMDITERKENERRLANAQRELQGKVRESEELAERRLAQIRRMTHELVVSESEERRRLATDLHDNLGQQLNLALLRLGVLREESVDGVPKSRIEDVTDLIKGASEMTRSITAQLSPQVLDELGLSPALEWLAEEIEKLYELRVEVNRRADPVNLSHSSELIVFRSVRELLINVARHAGVDEAELRMLKGDLGYRIEVRDGGGGFDVDRVFRRANRGYGLLGLQERISHIGGTVTIDSSPGKGCIVVLEIPDPTPPTENLDDSPADHRDAEADPSGAR